MSTPLLIYVAGREGAIPTTIGALAGTVVSFSFGSENLQIDLQEADFHGEVRPESSRHGAFLIVQRLTEPAHRKFSEPCV
jgi:hypothetical protein